MSGRRSRFARLAACVAVGLALAVAIAGPASAGKSDGKNIYKTPGEADGATPPIALAKSWLIADADTGEVLAAKNPHLRLRPASTLKTLTAVTLLPRLDKQDVYKVQWRDAASIGSTVGIVPDATYTIDQLFYGMLLPSGNDAAHALANAAGSVNHTVAMMNAEAKRLGANDTTVKNPSGLDADGQYTSAFDLAVFAKAGLQRPDFRRYVGTVTTAFPAEMPKKDKKRKTYQIYNQNPLLLNGYRGTIGVKTGYTTLAGSTFSGAVERGGRTYVVTLMGLAEPTETAAKRLFNWVFKRGQKLTPIGDLDPPSDRQRQVAAPQPAAVTDTLADQEPTPAGWSSVWVALLVAVIAMVALAVMLSRRARR